MTSDTFDQQHPRGHAGRFTEKPSVDPGVTVLAVPAGPPTDIDKENLTRFAGWSARGYDDYDLGMLREAMPRGYQIRFNDQTGQLEGRTNHLTWRPLSAEFNQYLAAGKPGDPVPDQLLHVEPQPIFGMSENDWLTDNAGVFVDGYTDDMIDGFASGLPSVQIACVWNTYDHLGFGGDSDLYGRVPGGPWRFLSNETLAYLMDGQPGDPVPDKFLADNPADLTLDIDTVKAMTGHNYTLWGDR